MTYLYNIALCFHHTAQKYSDQVALNYPGEKSFSYAELNSLSNKIAQYLLQKGISKGEVVAIFNNKSPEAFASMLACLKTGAIYCNLDLTSPFERLEKITGKCQPTLLVNDGGEDEKINKLQKAIGIPVLHLNHSDEKKKIGAMQDELPEVAELITGDHPAYIMFTSGSTGFPKGAVMSHQNVLNLAKWGEKTFSISPDDCLTNVNPIYFDNSVFDFYSSLLNGASLAPFVQEVVNNPRLLVEQIEKAKCTIWFSVPSLLVYLLTTKVLQKENMKTITRFSFGGEGFPKPQLKKLFDLYHERAELINVYGPTECTCICSSYPITKEDFEDMKSLAPLGYIAPNFDYLIVSEDGESSDAGELYLKGPNVGMGYYNDQERTAASFVQHPLNDAYAEIVYKTGDLVEKDEKGQLHFRGRVDNQIKHMGYRIELEEIEAALNMLAYVDEVGVTYKDLGNGMGQIKAHISANNEVRKEDVEKDLKEYLPPYMMPKVIKFLDTLPKNRNGKIDRKKLVEL